MKPAEKMLLADAKFYSVEQLRLANGDPIPGQEWRLNFTYSSPAQFGENGYDMYRHGKNPPVMAGTTRMDPKQGKIAFNILYCDGHVETAITYDQGYRAIRLRHRG